MIWCWERAPYSVGIPSLHFTTLHCAGTVYAIPHACVCHTLLSASQHLIRYRLNFSVAQPYLWKHRMMS